MIGGIYIELCGSEFSWAFRWLVVSTWQKIKTWREIQSEIAISGGRVVGGFRFVGHTTYFFWVWGNYCWWKHLWIYVLYVLRICIVNVCIYIAFRRYGSATSTTVMGQELVRLYKCLVRFMQQKKLLPQKRCQKRNGKGSRMYGSILSACFLHFYCFWMYFCCCASSAFVIQNCVQIFSCNSWKTRDELILVK